MGERPRCRSRCSDDARRRSDYASSEGESHYSSTGSNAIWQWRHTGGWHDYPNESNIKLEAAWSSGVPQLIVSHGVDQRQNTIVDFQMMTQYNEATGLTRAI